MRAEARLALDRELRNEPLEEFTLQEVNELTEGIRQRVYTPHWHRQEKEDRRIQDREARTRATQRDQDRTHTERTRKKVVFLDEARRRAVALLKPRALSFLQRLQILEDILTQLDATLTGDELLSDAYASIEAVLQARVADWDADDAAQAARQQEEWWDIGAAVVVILSLWFMYAKGPDILQWLWKILSPEPAENSERAQQPDTEAPPQTSEESLSPRPVKRIRRPRTSPATEPTSPPPYPESENRSV
jgi:DNA primase